MLRRKRLEGSKNLCRIPRSEFSDRAWRNERLLYARQMHGYSRSDGWSQALVMQIQLNSKPRDLPDGATVAALIDDLKLGEKRVKVKVASFSRPMRFLHPHERRKAL